jgi:predicted RNase H-like HicB family nuclease
LPGLGVAGKTIEEVKDLISEAIEFHLEGMRQHGEAIPKPTATTEFITI